MKTLKFIYTVIRLCYRTNGWPVVCFTHNGKDQGLVLEGGKQLASKRDIERLAGQLEDYAILLREGNVKVIIVT